MKCMMCAQTKPFDRVTIFLTQQCPAENQAHWELRIQQLKSEMDKEQQGRAAKDFRCLMGLQANTPRQKDRKEEETPRRVVKSATGSRKPNLGSLSAKLRRHRSEPNCTKASRKKETSTGSLWTRNFSGVSSVGKQRFSTKPRSCSNSDA